MLFPRLVRPIAVCAALVATLLAVTGCRTSPGVAAYVGSETISTAVLDDRVDAGLRVPTIAELFDGRVGAYRQLVLQELIDTEVYDAVAVRYDLEVSDAEVSSRLQEILDGQGLTAEDFFGQQAGQGRTETAVREEIRQFVIGEQVAAAAGLDDATSDAALQAQYDATRDQFAQYSVGLITVADQATADGVLAAITADPSSYGAQAALYAGQNTLPELTTASPEQLTGLVEDLTTLQAGQGFAAALLPTGEITVVFIAAIDYPAFEDLRPTLEQQAGEQVQAAVENELQSVRGGLDITVNPRYGSYDDTGVLGPDDRGVVTVVDPEPTAAAPLN